MARRNRDTLKNYFEKGKRPSQEAFEDLIDSSLNTLDDGFSGSPETGIGLSPLNDKGVIISAYNKPGDEKALWEIAVKDNDLHILHCDDNDNSVPVFTIRHQGDKNHRSKDILIEGTISCSGRKGSYLTGEVPADGKWHDILGDPVDLEEGCWAFEVVAGCGERNSGRYALMTATAMHCFGNKPRIKKLSSNFGVFGNRLCIRWVKMKNRYTCRLQLKTFFRYTEGVNIKYQIAKLWDNPMFDD